MDLKEIIDRNYKATVKRGLITDKTDFDKFISKLDEETDEVVSLMSAGDLKYLPDSVIQEDENLKHELSHELSDIIIVCLAMAKHYDIDIQQALEEKTLYNETRKD